MTQSGNRANVRCLGEIANLFKAILLTKIEEFLESVNGLHYLLFRMQIVGLCRLLSGGDIVLRI